MYANIVSGTLPTLSYLTDTPHKFVCIRIHPELVETVESVDIITHGSSQQCKEVMNTNETRGDPSREGIKLSRVVVVECFSSFKRIQRAAAAEGTQQEGHAMSGTLRSYRGGPNQIILIHYLTHANLRHLLLFTFLIPPSHHSLTIKIPHKREYQVTKGDCI